MMRLIPYKHLNIVCKTIEEYPFFFLKGFARPLPNSFIMLDISKGYASISYSIQSQECCTEETKNSCLAAVDVNTYSTFVNANISFACFHWEWDPDSVANLHFQTYIIFHVSGPLRRYYIMIWLFICWRHPSMGRFASIIEINMS